MKPTLICLFAFLFCVFELSAQDDILKTLEIPGVKKITAAIGHGNHIAFCTKNKWGMFDADQKKIIVEPKFQRIVFLPEGSPAYMDGFFGLIKNKIGYYSLDGKELIRAVYMHLGFFSRDRYSGANYVLADAGVFLIKEDPTGNGFTLEKQNYFTGSSFFSSYKRFSIAVKNDLLAINDFEEMNNDVTDPYYRFDEYGTRIDSIVHDASGQPVFDANGNPTLVFPPPYPGYSKSGVFDYTKNTWLIPAEFTKLIPVTNGFAMYKKNADLKGHLFLFSFYDPSGKLIVNEKPLNIIATDAQAMQKILELKSLPSLKMTENTYSSMYSQHQVNVTVNGLSGIYDFTAMRWVIPIQYQFIYETELSSYTTITLKDGKFGALIFRDITPFIIPNKYSSIEYKFSNNNDNTGACIYLDGEPYIVETVSSEKEVLKKMPNTPVYYRYEREFSISMSDKDQVIITDRQDDGPRDETPYWRYDAYGTRIDSIMVDAVGKPMYDMEGIPTYVYPLAYYVFNKSGVFNLKKNKWVVPQEFKRVVSFSAGLASYKDNKNRIDGEHRVLMSFYNKQGDAFFKDVPVNHVAQNSSFVKTILGLSDIPSLKVFDDPFYYSYENSFPLLVSFDNKMGVFDLLNLQWIIPMQYDRIDKSNVLTHYIIYKDAKMGIVNYAGKILVPPLFTELKLIANDNLLTNNGLVYNVNLDAQTIGGYVAPYTWLSTQNDEQYSPDYKISFHALIKGETIIVNEWTFERTALPYTRYDWYGNQIDSVKLDASGNAIYDASGNAQLVYPPDKNNAWARMYDLKSIYNYEFDSVRSIEEIPLGYLLETKNSQVYLVDKDFKLLSKLAYSRYEKHGDAYFLQRENRDYIVNAEGMVAVFDGSYIDGPMLNSYYDIVTPQKFIQLPLPKHLIYYFPWGAGLVYEVRPDEGGINMYEVKWSYVDLNTMREIIPNMNIRANLCFINNVNETYRMLYDTYSISEEYLLKANAMGFDSISKVQILMDYRKLYERSFYTKEESGKLYALDFADNSLFSGNARGNEDPSIDKINDQRFWVHTMPYVRLCDRNGNIIADSLENIIPFTFEAINRVPIGVFAANKKGKQYIFNMDGKVIFDLGPVNDMSRFVNITQATEYLDIYQVEQGLVRIPFRFKNGEVVRFTPEPLNLFKVIGTGQTQLVAARTAKSSFITNIDGKVIYTFKPNQQLEEIYEDSTAVIFDGDNKGYGFFDVNTKKLLGVEGTTIPEKIYTYNGIDTTISFFVTSGRTGKQLLAVEKTPQGKKLKTLVAFIVSYALVDQQYMVITNSNGQFLYDMNKRIFLTTTKGRTIKSVQSGFPCFIARDNSSTVLILPSQSQQFDLGNVQIDSVCDAYEGWKSTSEPITAVYVFANKKKGWYNFETKKLLAPLYEKVQIPSFFNGSNYLSVDNNLYVKKTGSFAFPADTYEPLKAAGEYFVYARSATSQKKYLYNIKTNATNACEHEIIGVMSNGKLVIKKQNRIGVYDASTLKVVCEAKYDNVDKISLSDNSNPFYAFKLNGKTGLMDSAFNVLMPAKYDSLEILNLDSLFYIMFRSNKKWGLMTTGQKIITPAVYSSISSTDHGFLITTLEIPSKIKNGDPTVKYGLCTLYGREIISCRFDDYVYSEEEDVYFQGQIGKKWYKVLKTTPVKLEEVKE